MAEVDRVQVEFFSQFVHLQLGHPERLGGAEAAEGGRRDVVGVDPVDIFLDIGDEIRTGGGDGAVAEHLVTGIHVGAGIGDNGGFGC